MIYTCQGHTAENSTSIFWVYSGHFCRHFSLEKCLKLSTLVGWQIVETKEHLRECSSGLFEACVYFDGPFEVCAFFQLGQGDGMESWGSGYPTTNSPMPACSCYMLRRKQRHKLAFASKQGTEKAHHASLSFLSLLCRCGRARKHSWGYNTRSARNPLYPLRLWEKWCCASVSLVFPALISLLPFITWCEC